MRKTVHKWFWAWDFDKEEKWLNEMAAKGLGLISVGFCRYDFEDCAPGEYAYRLELLENHPNHAESRKYIDFLEETGAEHVGSFMRWIYLRKSTSDGTFDLFSDNASKIKHLTRIIALIVPLSLANLAIGLSNISSMIISDIAISAVGFLNLAIALIGLYGSLRLYKRRTALKKAQHLFE